MNPARRLVLAVVASVGSLLGCGAPVPDGLGPRDGTLAPCPDTPNCVHTGNRHPEGTEGIDLADTEGDVTARLREVVEAMPRVEVVETSPGYIHAEATSRIFRFVDDLELLVAPDGELVVRSASRVGRSDLGANEDRVQRLRERLREAGLIR